MTIKSFTDLRSNIKEKQALLREAIVKERSGGKKEKSDTRFWTPSAGKDGTGLAIIRFLPAPQNENLPYVKYFDHYFEGPGGIYYEKSLTTFANMRDPVSDMNNKLWRSNDDSAKKLASSRARRLHHITNIYVIHDRENPQNEGKVFLFKFGKKLWNKIDAAMVPPDTVSTAIIAQEIIDPFNLYAPPSDLSKKEAKAWVEANGDPGANFIIPVKMVSGYKNYDDAKFDSPSSLAEVLKLEGEAADKKMEEIWKSQYSLQTFIDKSQFKSYDELQERLNRVLAGDNPSQSNGNGYQNGRQTSKPASVVDASDLEEEVMSDDLAEFTKLLND